MITGKSRKSDIYYLHITHLFAREIITNIDFALKKRAYLTALHVSPSKPCLAMYGDAANKLMLEAKRSSNLNEVPLYQHDLIKDIVQEMSDLNRDVEYLDEQQKIQDEEVEDIGEEERKVNQCQLFVTHLSMRRNKRCLLAYQKLRADKIDEFSWLNIDPVLSSETNRNSKKDTDAPTSPFGVTKLALDNLSHHEQEYFKRYQELVLDFKSSISDIDLSGDLEPPTEIFIDVRVLKDGGEIQTEYGVFNLIKDSQFYVRKSDVDRLIQQGYLEEI